MSQISAHNPTHQSTEGPMLGAQAGQAIVEYLLILVFALTTSLFLVRSMGGVMDRGLLRFGGELEKNLKTGGQTLDAWKN